MPSYRVYFFQKIKKAPEKKVAPWRLLGACAPFPAFFRTGALRLQQLYSRTNPGVLVGQLVGWSYCQTFTRRLWTVTERPQRLVTFETFDQSDETK